MARLLASPAIRFIAAAALAFAMVCIVPLLILMLGGALGGCTSTVKVEPAKAESSRKVEDAWSRTTLEILPKGEVGK